MRKLEQVLNGAIVCPPPVWLMRQAGRYLPEYKAMRSKYPSFLDLCFDPKGVCETTLQPVKRFDFDAAIIFSDILVVPYALGLDLDFTEAGPKLKPITDARQCFALTENLDPEKITVLGNAIKRTREKLHPDKSLLAFAGAPWTLACYMLSGHNSMDFLIAKKFAYQNGQAFSALLETLTKAISTYLLSMLSCGADCIQLFDSWSGILPPDAFQAWCVKPVETIIKNVKAVYPDTKIILFSKCDGENLRKLLQIDGLDCMSLGFATDMAALLEGTTVTCALQGNMDPALCASGGQHLRHYLEQTKELAKRHPLVLNLGHGILQHTPPGHVEDIMSILRS